MEKQKILQEQFSSILGQEEVKKQIKSALLSNRHVILVGPPGVGKTTLAKELVKLIREAKVKDFITGKEYVKKGQELFVRVQGSPDLTAEDLIGDIDPIKAMKYGPLSLEAFIPGKIFKADKGILFFDEVNRCGEKLQNTLLQVLEEGRVTIGSYDVDIPSDFTLIGTMNPEDSTTQELSDVFLDRFDLIYVTHPEKQEIEEQIVRMKGKKLDVEFSQPLLNWMVEFVRDLRTNKNLERKPGVRASLGLYERAQANALLNNRKKVKFEDIHEAVKSVLTHRMRLSPSIKFLETPESFIEKEFQKFASEKEPSDVG